MRLLASVLGLTLAAAAGLPAGALSSSADAPHVHVQLVVPDAALKRGQAAEAGLYFKLEPGWHVYWINAGDAGEPPHIKWTLPAGIAAGPLQFPAPKRLPLGPLMDFGYEDEVLFPFTLNVAQTAASGWAVLHARVTWLVCQDRCIPGKAELEATRGILAQGGRTTFVPEDRDIFQRLSGRLPRSLPAGVTASFQPSKDGFLLTVDTGRRETQAAFFPADPDTIDNPAPQMVAGVPNGLVLDLKKDANLKANPAQLKGVLELSGGRAYEIDAPLAAPAAASGSRSRAAHGAPATVAKAHDGAKQSAPAPPVQPASSYSNPPPAALLTTSPAASNPFSALDLLRAAALALLGGLLLNLMPCVFPVLFLKGLALVNSRHEERGRLRVHGLVYAAGILASFWALVALLLGLRAAGATLGWGFQFQSPVFLELMAGLLFFLGLSLAGQFEIGLTLTSAGGSLAQKHGLAGSFFTGVLAVVVATPCTAPFMGAALGYALAQSALVTFSVFTALALGLAAPYVALTLHPAWTRVLPRPGVWMEVMKQAVAVPIFATVIWLAWVLARAYGADLLMALLGSFLLLAIAGWFLGRWPARRWAAVVAGLLVVAVVAGCVVAPKKVDSARPALAPEDVKALSSLPSVSNGWQPWSAQAVKAYQAQGRSVLVDFTASWCLSCQVNERVALTQPEVEKALADGNVALLKADWTRGDEAITQTLASFGRSGVPAYALYVPGETSPRLLPEVLTPGIVIGAVANLPKAATASVSTASGPN